MLVSGTCPSHHLYCNHPLSRMPNPPPPHHPSRFQNYRRNGDAFVNYLSITPIHDPAGRLTHYVGIQSDITELVAQKRAELAAKHAAVQVGVGVSCIVVLQMVRMQVE